MKRFSSHRLHSKRRQLECQQRLGKKPSHMKKRLAKKGFSLSEELIWILMQAIMAAGLTLLLFGFVSMALNQTLVLKQFYPGHFAITMTALSHMSDNTIVVDKVASYEQKIGKAVFSIEGTNGNIGVSANIIKVPTKHFTFTPASTPLTNFKIEQATGIVELENSGSAVEMRNANPNVDKRSLHRCPQGKPDPAWFDGIRVVIDIMPDSRMLGKKTMKKAMEDAATTFKQAITAKGGSVEISAEEEYNPETSRPAMAEADISIRFRTDPAQAEDNRVVAMYKRSTQALKSQRLGCSMLNAFISRGLLAATAGSAVVPGRVEFPDDRIAVEIIIDPGKQLSLLADPLALGKALYAALEEYYG